MNLLFRTESNDFISILHVSSISDEGKIITYQETTT